MQVKHAFLFIAFVFLLIAATAVNLEQLYYMAATLAALPFVSIFIGWLNQRGLHFERHAPSVAWEGETVTFTLVCRSTARTPKLLLRAVDSPSKWIVPEYDEPPVFNAPAGAETRVEYSNYLRKRGLHRIDNLRIVASDPMGIGGFSRTFPVASEVLVYPKPQRIPNVLLTGAERFGYRDMPIAAARGSGVDFDGVREYTPGDPLRRMHWKSYARTGRLNIVEFEESRAVSLVLALDLQQGTNVGEDMDTTLEYLIRAAASVAQLGIRQGAAVRLAAGPEPDPANLSGRGTDHLLTILSCLARAEAVDPEPFASRLVERVGRVPAGASLMAFTSVIDEALLASLLLYTSSGAHTMLVYADPRSFVPSSGRLPTVEQQNGFLRAVASVGCIPLVLRRHPEGILDLQQAQETGLGSVLSEDD